MEAPSNRVSICRRFSTVSDRFEAKMSGLSLLAIFTFWIFTLWHITLVLNSKRKSSITASIGAFDNENSSSSKQDSTLLRGFLFFLKYKLNFVSRLNVFCFNLLILQWSFAIRFDKKLGNSPRGTRAAQNLQMPHARPPGLKRRANAPR